MDLKFYEEENKLLRQLAQHWEQMYNHLKTEYDSLLKNYDDLVMETVKRDLEDAKTN